MVDPLVSLEQARISAEQLDALIAAGDDDARRRVLAVHPSFAGRPAERFDPKGFGLADAQVTVAIEGGYDDWATLVADLAAGTGVRWGPERHSIGHRAMDEAARTRSRYCSTLHFVLALLEPPVPGAAAEILAELGLSRESVARLITDRMPSTSDGSVTASPRYHQILARAEGLALAWGDPVVTDEHVLVSLFYCERDAFDVDLDPDEVLEMLAARGHRVPASAPPLAKPWRGPAGPFVYYPSEDQAAVIAALSRGAAVESWGFNRSRARPGWHCVVGVDALDLETIVRGAVADPARVVVVDRDEAAAAERDAGD